MVKFINIDKVYNVKKYWDLIINESLLYKTKIIY